MINAVHAVVLVSIPWFFTCVYLYLMYRMEKADADFEREMAKLWEEAAKRTLGAWVESLDRMVKEEIERRGISTEQ